MGAQIHNLRTHTYLPVLLNPRSFMTKSYNNPFVFTLLDFKMNI